MTSRPCIAVALCLASFASSLFSQELPKSGVFGLDLVYATSAGSSQLYLIAPGISNAPIAIGPSVSGVPSRWAHRRRTLGALETAIEFTDPFVLFTPMGDAAANGAIHMIDARTGVPPSSVLAPTGNPPGYDLKVAPDLRFVFAASDAGGTTQLSGFSFVGPGQLVPLSPPTLLLPGSPCAYVNRMGYDEVADALIVPTTAGINIVQLASAGTQMTAATLFPTSLFPATTNPVAFDLGGVKTWVVGTANFAANNKPRETGWLAFRTTGVLGSASFGSMPGSSTKFWLPAIGAEELAVVSNGANAYVYYLLRDPDPQQTFIKPGGVGSVRFLGASAPASSVISCPTVCGEPFSNPDVQGTRVAFESSVGAPAPDGSERLVVVYSPLDPLGAASQDGVIAVGGPLGGRVSTTGMDRPLWSRDGKAIVATTSQFPGAPSVGVPGVEVLDVPAAVALNTFQSPHTVVPDPTSPFQSIVHGSAFRPREPALVPFLTGLSFAGSLYHDGLRTAALTPFGAIGQFQQEPIPLTLPAGIPGFPSILPASFEDATASLVAIPPPIGARRTSFNVVPNFGILGLTMIAAAKNELLVQPTGWNTLAQLGLQAPIGTLRIALPAGSVTTSEFRSL